MNEQSLIDAGYKFIGIANDLSPALIEKIGRCRRDNHITTTVDLNERKNWSLIYCPRCLHYYKVDSSD